MSSSNHTYQVGVSTVDITPPVGIYLAGFAARQEPSTEVYHPLKATAVAIDDGETPLLIVGAEILGFYERTEEVRSRINAATGIDPAHIILNGSHTHCGPCIREMDRERHGELDEDYLEDLFENVAELCKNGLGRSVSCAPSFWYGALRYREVPSKARWKGRCGVGALFGSASRPRCPGYRD